jgi:hypothetical protein
MSRAQQSYQQAATIDQPTDQNGAALEKAQRGRFFWVVLSALALAEFARANDAVILPIIVSVSQRDPYFP